MRNTLLQEDRRRQRALVALLITTIPGAGLFLICNLLLKSGLLALLHLLLVIASIGFLTALRRGVPLQPLALGYLLLLHTVILVALTRPDIHPGVYMWMATIPILSYLLLPLPLAFWLTVGSLMTDIVAYVIGQRALPHDLGVVHLIHTAAPLVGLFLVCHCYARSQYLTDGRMLESISQEPLTGLWNRKKLLTEFDREQQRARRTGLPLSLILIDLDYFKKINDTYGHDAGDAALVFFARLLERRLRETDLPCRFGGEEFAVLLPDTPAAGAAIVAEDIRSGLETSDFLFRGEHLPMTLSAGVVELGRDGNDWATLYRVADERLYASKKLGRNQVRSVSKAGDLTNT